MSEALYVRVTVYHDEEDNEDWFHAQVFFNGEPVAAGMVPNRPPYRAERVGPSSAITLAISRFCRTVGKDVRYVGCDAQGVIKKSTPS